MASFPLRSALVLSCALCWSVPAMAQTYGMQDLSALVERKEFAEAVMHLRDISPTARDAAWDDIAVRALIGNAEALRKESAGEAYRYLTEGTRAFPSIAEDKRVHDKLVELGILTVRERKFYGVNEREKVVEAVLALDANAIVPLVTEASYDDWKQRIFVWIDQHPQEAKGNAALKTYALRVAGRKSTSETPQMTQTKFSALKKAGWADDWAKADYAKVATYADELMRGEFGNQHNGRVMLTALEEAGYKNEDIRVRFYAPLALMRSSTTSVDPLEKLQGASSASLKKAERELLSSKPQSAFWFGGAWEEKQWQQVRKLFPEVTKLAEQECAAKRNGQNKEPAHVSYGGCEWIK